MTTNMLPFFLQCKTLRRKLDEGMVFTEYEQIPKRKADGVFTTATLPENMERNRVREDIPYEENRVELVPTKENPTGYINASHVKVTYCLIDSSSSLDFLIPLHFGLKGLTALDSPVTGPATDITGGLTARDP